MFQREYCCMNTVSGVFNSAMRETKEALENASMGLEVLQEGTGKLGFNLSLVRTSINRTLGDPGCHDEESDATTAQLCRYIRQSLSQLQISANFTRVCNHNAIRSAAEQFKTGCHHISCIKNKSTIDCINAVEWFPVMILNPHPSTCYFLHLNACSRSLNIYDVLLIICSLHVSLFIF